MHMNGKRTKEKDEMTTKEAAERFDIKERIIQKLASEGKIAGTQKVRGCYEIPNDTAIIITDQMARAFLLKLLKLKNNPGELVSTYDLLDEKISRTWYRYLLEQEVIGDCEYTPDPRELMLRMKLTNKGLEAVVGKRTLIKIENVSIAPTFYIGCNVATVSLIP